MPTQKHLYAHAHTNTHPHTCSHIYTQNIDGSLIYYAPLLTDEDFNKPIGKYSQSVFLQTSSRALSATSLGNLVVWATNKPLTES